MSSKAAGKYVRGLTTIDKGHQHSFTMRVRENGKVDGMTESASGHKHRVRIVLVDSLVKGRTNVASQHKHQVEASAE